MNRLLALDPGKSTGYSVWEYDAITPLRPVDHGTIIGGVRGLIAWWHDMGDHFEPDEVVSESFALDGRTLKPDVEPLKIEGALLALWPDVIFQPNLMKRHMPDERIKALGLWWPGKGHDRDSLRHAFALMKMRKHYPTLMAAWPPRVAA